MTPGFTPCACGAEHSIRIQELWKGLEYNVAVVYCYECRDCEPFKYTPWGNIPAVAAIAWNSARRKR